MAIAFRSTGGSAPTFNPGPIALSAPTGVQATDVVLAFVIYQGGTGSTVTAPAGWTPILKTDSGTTFGIASFWALGSVASYAFSFTGGVSAEADGYALAYSGVDNATPIDTFSGATGGSTLITASAVNTANANEMLLGAFAYYDGGGGTPGTWSAFFGTERGPNDQLPAAGAFIDGSFSFATIGLDCADAIQASAGNSGSKSASESDAGAFVTAAQLIALSPGGGAAVMGTRPSYGPKLHGRPNPVSRFRSTRYPGAFDPNAQEREQRRAPTFWMTPGVLRRPTPDPRSRFLSPFVVRPTPQLTTPVILPQPPLFWATPGAFFPSRRRKFISPQAFLRGPDPAPPGSASFWRSSGPSRFAKGGPVSRFRSTRAYFTPAASGPTNYLQSVAGTLTSIGVLVKQTSRALAGTLTSLGTFTAMKVALVALAGTLTPSGALVKRTARALAGALTSAGALVKQTTKTFAGTLTDSGALVKRTAKTFAGTLTSAGALVNRTGKVLAASMASAGALVKQTAKFPAGSMASAGALTKQTARALAGTLSSSGALVKRTGKILVAALTSAGALLATKVSLKALAGTLTSAGALVKQTQLAKAGVLTSAGAMVKQTRTSFAGALGAAGGLSKRITRALSGVLSSIGALIPGLRPPNVDNILPPIVIVQAARAPMLLQQPSRAAVIVVGVVSNPIVLKTRS